MLKTQTGGFPIGFRRGWSDWQKDLPSLLGWAKEAGFSVLDLGRDANETARAVREAGLSVGSADLLRGGDLLSPDPRTRAEAVEENRAYFAACAPEGVRNYFTVFVPKDRERSRRENFGFLVEGLRLLGPALEEHGGRLVIEGWPGPGALCCNPETYRGAIQESGSPAIGINYDPSHLIRMGIDPIRFLLEFKERVFHVHGKDTERFPEAVYEVGTEQPPTLVPEHGFGSATWRYTIPGHGEMRWTEGFRILKEAGYDGAVSIELEDERFNGSEAGEKAGLIASGQFLSAA